MRVGTSVLGLSPPNKHPLRVFWLSSTSPVSRLNLDPGLSNPTTTVFPQPCWQSSS